MRAMQDVSHAAILQQRNVRVHSGIHVLCIYIYIHVFCDVVAKLQVKSFSRPDYSLDHSTGKCPSELTRSLRQSWQSLHRLRQTKFELVTAAIELSSKVLGCGGRGEREGERDREREPGREGGGGEAERRRERQGDGRESHLHRSLLSSKLQAETQRWSGTKRAVHKGEEDERNTQRERERERERESREERPSTK